MALQNLEDLDDEDREVLLALLGDKTPQLSKMLQYRLRDLELVEEGKLTDRGYLTAQLLLP
jgi:hypothetical protein